MKITRRAQVKPGRKTKIVSSRPSPKFALAAFLSRKRKQVDTALDRALPRKDYYPAKLHSAMRHSVFSGGKRLRPILVLSAAEACGQSVQTVMPAACALECVHTYSLIHDDLPAMDDDDWRRGKATCHKVFGEAAAVLAGDALLTFAFELMTRVPTSAPGGDRGRLEATRLLAQASGMAGMVGGQMADIMAEGQDVNLPILQYIHTHKTGRLIQASLMIGGVVAGASASQLKALSTYGETLGLAFQIADDVLNVVGEMKQMGKSVGTDSVRGKATYPALYGVEESRAQAHRLMERGIQALHPLGQRAEPLRALARYIVQREE